MIDMIDLIREKQIEEQIREESRPYLRIPEPTQQREREGKKKEETTKRVIIIQL